MMGQPIRTTNTPPRKKLVALTLCHWKKNRNVRSKPMTKDSPETNRICAQKSKCLSDHTWEMFRFLLINSHFQWREELCQRTASSRRGGKTPRSQSAPSRFLQMISKRHIQLSVNIRPDGNQKSKINVAIPYLPRIINRYATLLKPIQLLMLTQPWFYLCN